MWSRSHTESCIPPSHRGSAGNLVSIILAVLEKKKLKILNLRHPGQRSVNGHDLLHKSSSISWVPIESEKSTVSPFTPYKTLSGRIWPWHKTGQGQSRVIIWVKLTEPKPPTLHTKFQGHLLSGFWDFQRFSLYLGVAAILVMWPKPMKQTFTPTLWRLDTRTAMAVTTQECNNYANVILRCWYIFHCNKDLIRLHQCAHTLCK